MAFALYHQLLRAWTNLLWDYDFKPRLFKWSLDWACGAMDPVAIEEKVAFCLFTYGFNIKRKNIKEKKY